MRLHFAGLKFSSRAELSNNGNACQTYTAARGIRCRFDYLAEIESIYSDPRARQNHCASKAVFLDVPRWRLHDTCRSTDALPLTISFQSPASRGRPSRMARRLSYRLDAECARHAVSLLRSRVRCFQRVTTAPACSPSTAASAHRSLSCADHSPGVRLRPVVFDGRAGRCEYGASASCVRAKQIEPGEAPRHRDNGQRIECRSPPIIGARYSVWRSQNGLLLGTTPFKEPFRRRIGAWSAVRAG